MPNQRIFLPNSSQYENAMEPLHATTRMYVHATSAIPHNIQVHFKIYCFSTCCRSACCNSSSIFVAVSARWSRSRKIVNYLFQICVKLAVPTTLHARLDLLIAAMGMAYCSRCSRCSRCSCDIGVINVTLACVTKLTTASHLLKYTHIYISLHKRFSCTALHFVRCCRASGLCH